MNAFDLPLPRDPGDNNQLDRHSGCSGELLNDFQLDPNFKTHKHYHSTNAVGLEEAFDKLFEIIDSRRSCSLNQTIVLKYFEIVRNTISIDENLKRKFNTKSTDFERVCFFLKLLQRSDEDGKLDYSTLAVFHATSEMQLHLALAERSAVLYGAGLFKEAIRDARRALKLTCQNAETGNIHFYLGKCYKELGDFKKAKKHFREAGNILEKCLDAHSTRMRAKAAQGLNDCLKEEKEGFKSKVCQSQYKVIRPNLPQVSSGNSQASVECQVPSSRGNFRPLLLKDNKGWAMVATRNVKVGEVLAIEKPYAVSSALKRTAYCHMLSICNDIKSKCVDERKLADPVRFAACFFNRLYTAPQADQGTDS
ncbi:hypothetical protein ACTXT7_008102 [Hymenolepis weldensis]